MWDPLAWEQGCTRMLSREGHSNTGQVSRPQGPCGNGTAGSRGPCGVHAWLSLCLGAASLVLHLV